MKRNDQPSRGNRRHWKALAVVVSAGLVLAACGGGSSKKKTNTATGDSTTTSSTVADASTTTTAVGETTSTTAASGATTGATTATTKKPTTVTTRRSSAVAPVGNISKAPTGGINNIAATTTTATPSNVQIGGSINWLKAGEIPVLDPAGAMANSGASDGPAGFAIFDMLFYSEAGQVKTHTAESLTSPDGIVWNLKLRPNILFSDGTPYDANAIVFNLKRLQDPANGATRKPQADQIQDMTVVDSLNLKLTLKAKNALFPGAFALMPFIGSPTAITKQGKDDFAQHPVGAGPYVLKEWVRDSRMVVSRNTKYWDAPRPYIDEITFRPIIDETSRINTFCAGGADLMYIGAVTNADNVNKKKCGAINPLVLNGGTDLFFNTTKAPMNNAKLRMGIAKAIDPDAYSATVTNGLIAPTKSMFRPDSPFYDASILQPSFDKAAAQTLFDQAASELGVSTINIPMTTFQVLNYQNTAQYVAAVLNQFNHIKVDLITEASAAHITNCGNRAYTGICVFGTIFDDPDPTFTSIFLCGAATNYTGYCNTKFDDLVNDNHSTLDANKRVQDIKDMQKIFYTDVPALFVEQRYSWVFSAPGVQDFEFVNDGLPLLDRFWLKTH